MTFKIDKKYKLQCPKTALVVNQEVERVVYLYEVGSHWEANSI